MDPLALKPESAGGGGGEGGGAGGGGGGGGVDGVVEAVPPPQMTSSTVASAAPLPPATVFVGKEEVLEYGSINVGKPSGERRGGPKTTTNRDVFERPRLDAPLPGVGGGPYGEGAVEEDGMAERSAKLLEMLKDEGDSLLEVLSTKPGFKQAFEAHARYSRLVDRLKPKAKERWIVTCVLVAVYLLRTFLLNGWYIVMYGLGIYLLHILLGFLQPKETEKDTGAPILPTKGDSDGTIFYRQVPEFKAWYSATRGTLLAMFCTFFEAFNIPVYWQLLVFYFIVMFSSTLLGRYLHMKKYGYVPWSTGKRTYQKS